MPIFTQDYVALPGSVEAAAHHARAVAGAHLADRQAEAEQLVRDMFSIGLGATAPGGVLGLVTTADDGGIRFELIYPNDAIEPVIPRLHTVRCQQRPTGMAKAGCVPGG